MAAPAPGLLVSGMLGVVLGVALQLQQAELPGPLWHGAVAMFGLGLLGWALNRRQGERSLWRQTLVLVALAALAWSFTGVRATSIGNDLLAHELEGRDVQLTGIVASLPREGEMGSSFDVAVESAHDRGEVVTLPKLVRLSWWGARSGADQGAPLVDAANAANAAIAANAERLPQARVRPGERWQFTVRLQRPHGLSNPGGFDAELWFWEQGVGATGSVRAGRHAEPPQRLAGTWRFPIQQARHQMRERLREAVSSERAAGVMVALLAGDQASIANADWAIFRTTGVAHLVSVSGLHITMFAWLAMVLLRRLWTWAGGYQPALLWWVPTPVAALVGGVLLAAAYAAFSGWGVPAQRTVLMLAVVVALRLSGRHWPWPVVWLAAMNAVVWIDPWALMQPGFWLSFVAVGVLFATGGGPVAAPQQDARWRRELRDMLRTQSVITVALAPLTLLLFGEFSVIGFVANLVAIPWVTLLVTPLTMLGAIVPGLWWLTAHAVDALLWLLGWLAQWPWAALERPALPWGMAVLAVLGGLCLVLPWPLAWRLWGLLLLWPVLVYQPPRPEHGQFELLVADVGQGGGAIVRTAQHVLLYDAGPPWGRSSDLAQRVLLPLLRDRGERPHLVLVSHSDSDHAAGVPSIAAAFPDTRWKSSGPLPVDQVVAGCVAGQQWTWDGVLFEVLHPSRQDYAAGRMSDNARSCVLRVGGDQGVLLTGDIYMAEETRLALQRPDLRAAVLLLAHHGSKTSTAPVWLNTVQPSWAVVQAGHRNRYGHPAPEVLRRLDERGIPWVNTATCGAVHWRSEQPQQINCQRQTARRYWHAQAGAAVR